MKSSQKEALEGFNLLLEKCQEPPGNLLFVLGAGAGSAQEKHRSFSGSEETH